VNRILLILCIAAPVTAVSAASLEITNNTGGWDLMTVYVSPYGASGWGEDRLGDSTLTEGESVTLQLTAGIYSIRAIDIDGDTYTRMNIPILNEVEWAVTLDFLDGSDDYVTGGG
jgi:hypothetical protein